MEEEDNQIEQVQQSGFSPAQKWAIGLTVGAFVVGGAAVTMYVYESKRRKQDDMFAIPDEVESKWWAFLKSIGDASKSVLARVFSYQREENPLLSNSESKSLYSESDDEDF